MLTRTVKISNVTNLSDARYCAGMGVEMVGFSIDEDSPQYIAPKKFDEISSWLAGVQLVAETRSSNPDEIIAKLENYAVQMIQVEDPALLGYLSAELDRPLLLKIDAGQYDAGEARVLADRYGEMADYILFESDTDTQLNEEWIAALRSISSDNQVLVGFGFEDEKAVESIVSSLPEAGLALRGSEEIRPGYKDFGSMMDILEALEEQ